MRVQGKGTAHSEAEGKMEQKVDRRGCSVNKDVETRQVPGFCSYSKGLGALAEQEVCEGF